MNEAELASAGGGLVAVLASLAGALAIFRRRLSRDQTEMTKDRTESRFTEMLMSERNAAAEIARQASADRAHDLQAIARLEATNAGLAAELHRLQREFAAFKRLMVRLYPEASRFLASEPGAFSSVDLEL